MDIYLLLKTTGKSLFTRREMLSYGVSQYLFEKWVREGAIERIGRGLYRLSIDVDDGSFYEERFREATAIVGSQSAICLLSALEYYHLTDVITKSTWVMVPFDKRVKNAKITTFRTRNPHWSIGILRRKGFKITSIERTLIDCILNKPKIGTPTAIAAIKLALTSKKATLNSIYALSKKLGVSSRIQPIIEVLA